MGYSIGAVHPRVQMEVERRSAELRLRFPMVVEGNGYRCSVAFDGLEILHAEQPLFRRWFTLYTSSNGSSYSGRVDEGVLGALVDMGLKILERPQPPIIRVELVQVPRPRRRRRKVEQQQDDEVTAIKRRMLEGR